jgi:hypothetical protein
VAGALLMDSDEVQRDGAGVFKLVIFDPRIIQKW